jgi:hypothetical protein
VFKTLVRALLVLFYRVEVHGSEHMPRPGDRAVVVGVVPRITFVPNTYVTNWLFR